MKTIYYYAICITMSFFGAHAMEQSPSTKIDTMDQSTISKVRITASTMTLFGGWGFFAANSPYITNRIPMYAKRLPLAVFLVGCSVNQSFIINENIKQIKKSYE